MTSPNVKKSMVAKGLLHTGFLFLLLLSGITIFFSHQQKTLLERNEIQKRLFGGYVFLREKAPLFLENNDTSLAAALQREYQNTPEMLYFLLKNARGIPLAFSAPSANSQNFDQHLDRETIRGIHLFPSPPEEAFRIRCTLRMGSLPRDMEEPFSEKKALRGTHVVDLLWEIFSGEDLLGSYRQGFSLQDVHLLGRYLFLLSGSILLLLFSGILLIFYFVLRNMEEPLSLLAEDLEKINTFSGSSGELLQYLERSRTHSLPADFREMERLKRAFLELKRTLLFTLQRVEHQGLEVQNANNLLKRYSQTLENRVRERTALLEEKNHLLEKEVLERRKVEKQLRKLSITDSLTNLHNRRHANETMEALERGKTPFAILLLDMDDFKSVNDCYGHDAGDQVLIELAAILRETLEQPYTAARYGGEEFIILLPNTSPEEAYRLGERIRSKVEQTPLYYQGKSISVTLSLGVSFWNGSTSPDRAVTAADAALYEAKREGKNRTGQRSPEFSDFRKNS